MGVAMVRADTEPGNIGAGFRHGCLRFLDHPSERSGRAILTNKGKLPSSNGSLLEAESFSAGVKQNSS